MSLRKSEQRAASFEVGLSQFLRATALCYSAYIPRQFRPSVCLSVTRVYCIKTAERIIEILSLSDRLIILVFRHQGSLLKSDGFTPNGGAKYKGGSNFRWICGYISETVIDRGIVTVEDEYKVVCALSNSGAFDDPEWPRTPVSRFQYSLNFKGEYLASALLNRFRTDQGQCSANLTTWGQSDDPWFCCGEVQSSNCGSYRKLLPPYQVEWGLDNGQCWQWISTYWWRCFCCMAWQSMQCRRQTIQEAQLLLGDRATRKHATDSWNGRGNDNLGWMTFKCTSRSSKVAPIESQCMISY